MPPILEQTNTTSMSKIEQLEGLQVQIASAQAEVRRLQAEARRLRRELTEEEGNPCRLGWDGYGSCEDCPCRSCRWAVRD